MANAKTHKKSTGGQKQKASVRRLSSSTKTKKRKKGTPSWIYIIIGALCSTLLIAIAYYISLRPFLYLLRPCRGQELYGICMPAGHSIYGIDVSRHQGSIDWEQLKTGNEKNQPIDFVYIKATEGSDFLDLKFATNFAKAKEQEITRGAYHYFSKHSDGLAQAQMFIKNVKLEKGDLPPVVDVEEKPKDKKKFLQELKIFISKIEEHYGVKPIIYSYKKYREKYLSEQFFDKYPLWIAHYYVPKLDDGTEWLMWQCSDRGKIDGIVEKVDINIFNGSREQFNSLLIK